MMISEELERAYQQLEAHGVSRERARSVANGIEVLVSRLCKEVTYSRGEVERLRELISRLPDLVHDFKGYIPGDHCLRIAEAAGITVCQATKDLVTQWRLLSSC